MARGLRDVRKLAPTDTVEVALLRARLIEPNQPDFLHALAIFYLQGEEWVKAQRHAKALVEAVPGSRLPQELVQRAVAGAKGESATGED